MATDEECYPCFRPSKPYFATLAHRAEANPTSGIASWRFAWAYTRSTSVCRSLKQGITSGDSLQIFSSFTSRTYERCRKIAGSLLMAIGPMSQLIRSWGPSIWKEDEELALRRCSSLRS